MNRNLYIRLIIGASIVVFGTLAFCFFGSKEILEKQNKDLFSELQTEIEIESSSTLLDPSSSSWGLYVNRTLDFSFEYPSNWGNVIHERYTTGPQSIEEYEKSGAKFEFETDEEAARREYPIPTFSQTVTTGDVLKFSNMVESFSDEKIIDYPKLELYVFKYSSETPYNVSCWYDCRVVDSRILAQTLRDRANSKFANYNWYCENRIGPQSYTLERTCEIYQNNTNYKFILSYSPEFLPEDAIEKPLGELTSVEVEQYFRKYADFQTMNAALDRLQESVKFQ